MKAVILAGGRGTRIAEESALRPKPMITIGGRPVWVLPNPSGLNAHYKPADFARLYKDAGADCITLGNHSWDQSEALVYIERETRLLRPYNYPRTLNIPGRGSQLFTTPNGQRVFVVQIHGSAFMESLDDPIQGVQAALEECTLGQVADAVIIEMHAEATAEKYIMGHYCDGRATLVVGAHTHVPTGDAQILVNGTAYMSDAGMCGDYDSVIGMKKGPLVQRAATRLPTERKSPAEGPATMCGVFVESDYRTGLAVRVAPIRVGGRLQPTMPKLDE